MKRVGWRAVRLRPETLERLKAACSTMGVASPDALVERIIDHALVSAAGLRLNEQQLAEQRAAREAEDLLDPIPAAPSEYVEKMLNVRDLSLSRVLARGEKLP